MRHGEKTQSSIACKLAGRIAPFFSVSDFAEPGCVNCVRVRLPRFFRPGAATCVRRSAAMDGTAYLRSMEVRLFGVSHFWGSVQKTTAKESEYF